jgi:hypothetical protein
MRNVYGTTLPHNTLGPIFVMSQRFNTDNIVVEKGCASIKKTNILLIFIAEML